MPRFTIGIPTYNRASHLRTAIAAALAQTWPDVEVVVSDNASTDETPEVVRSFGHRVRYHRNAECIPIWDNFYRLTDLATGEYFSWLQDDDLIHRDFARRAVRAFESAPDVVVYAPYSANPFSHTTFHLTTLSGPSISVDWMRDELRVIDGIVVAPLSLFNSVAIPPGLAFRTDVLRKAVRHDCPDSLLFNERVIMAAAAIEGKMAVDPWVGALFFHHDQQTNQQAIRSGDNQLELQWIPAANRICELLEARPQDAWKPLLRKCFEDIPVYNRLQMLNRDTPPLSIWNRAHPLARRVRELLIETIPADQRGRIEVEYVPPPRLLRAVRQLTPPVLWGAVKSVRNSVRHRVNGVS